MILGNKYLKEELGVRPRDRPYYIKMIVIDVIGMLSIQKRLFDKEKDVP